MLMENEDRIQTEERAEAAVSEEPVPKSVLALAAVVGTIVIAVFVALFAYQSNTLNETDDDTSQGGSAVAFAQELDALEKRLDELDSANADMEWQAIDKEF